MPADPPAREPVSSPAYVPLPGSPPTQGDIRYRWTLLRAGAFKLDGGSMFGLIPRAVWSRQVPIDDRGRIDVQHNCLLLERIDPAPPAGSTISPNPPPSGPKLVLLETGTGNKLDPKSKDLFALADRWVGDALHEAGCRCEDIGAVLVSHLHFDHAGGLTRLARPGESPDWIGPASAFSGSRADHAVKRAFPSARIYAQAREWADALANKSVMTRTYFRDHLEPIADQLVALDSPRPFPTGLIPGRDDLPMGSALDRAADVPGVPGLRTLLVPGHTWGQQAMLFTDDRGRTVVFTPDVMPTAAHAGAASSLAYDVEPYTSMISKHWFLAAAAENRWTLVLDHEPAPPVFTVTANGKGWFDLEPAG